VETNLYRIAQEALNNVAKHAEASRVDVILEVREQSTVLIVEDDGIGFDPSQSESNGRAIGLQGMIERGGVIGADVQIESKAGDGTTVFVRVPLPTEESGAEGDSVAGGARAADPDSAG
jgi:two-component system sensor histidine kinase NreB